MVKSLIQDPHFTVELVSETPNPQTTIYMGLHQDYSEHFCAHEKLPNEKRCGELAVKNLLKGKSFHGGPLEHPQIVLNCGWFPHSVMQQIRTHRTGISFDCQSSRYTGERIVDAAIGKRELEEVFYLRPVGEYVDRKGCKYTYTANQRKEDLDLAHKLALHYANRIYMGFSREHARSMIAFDTRQHFVVSFNLRTAFHLMDMRAKSDAQLECQTWAHMVYPFIERWVPEIAEWYTEKRLGKGILAP